MTHNRQLRQRNQYSWPVPNDNQKTINDKNMKEFFLHNSFYEQYIPPSSETMCESYYSGSPIQKPSVPIGEPSVGSIASNKIQKRINLESFTLSSNFNIPIQKSNPKVKKPIALGFCCLCESHILIEMDMEIKLKCQHTFCKECLVKSIDENDDVKICCPFPKVNCNTDISDAELGTILGRNKFLEVMNKLENRISKKIADMKEEDRAHQLILTNLEHLELQDYNENTKTFECSVCFMEIEIGAGVILKNCLHECCKECINSTIQHSVDIVVKCPFMDNDGSCDKNIQDREIRALASKEVFEKHLEKSLNHAETVSEDTYHCKNPNCKGWVVYDKDVRSFECPVCKKVNCIVCKVIHHGKTCEQYEYEINPNSRLAKELFETEAALKALVASGEAMHCPKCEIIVQKADGCDYLTCAVCKLAICWVTRKPRHDLMKGSILIQGCKCNFAAGQRCHPNCGNCH